MRAGDVIHHANGMNVNRVDDIRRVYQQLAQADRLKLELYRNGKQEELNYRIVR
ncbi:MAG: PDZ domain-containing protein [Sulfurifustis sp.]